MADLLKLVPTEKVDKPSVLDELKVVNELIDELIATNDELEEDLEKIRLALGMDRYDFDRFKTDGFVRRTPSDVVGLEIDRIVEKLKKTLGH